MVFSSLLFVYAFLPLSLLVYYICPDRRSKNVALLVFSLIFYAWGEPKYVLLLMFMALSSWYCALRINDSPYIETARMWLTISIAVDIALIGFFKYSPLICSIFGTVPDFVARIALPIGISFYTFQLMTYVVDVYRGDAHAQRSYWNVLLYAALFHQCVAGPIVRYKTLARELFVSRKAGRDFLPGLRRFTVGLAKKALLANPCGALADQLLLTTATASNAALFSQNLSAIQGLTVLESWLGAAAYMLQIYLDFSAYSDMAIGMGWMLGFHYPENFNYPYISRSITDFWRRWHMSLSTFFRDYVYIPLGGNRVSMPRWLLNLFIVWALTGLWHGASWNFVLWGLYYFVFLVAEKLLLSKIFRKWKVLPHVYALFVVMVGWVLFRFTDVRLAWQVFRNLFALNGNRFSDFISVTVLENNLFLLIVCIFACTPLMKRFSDAMAARFRENGSQAWEIVRTCVVPVVLLLLATSSLVGDSYNPFIYFQF